MTYVTKPTNRSMVIARPYKGSGSRRVHGSE